MNIKAEALIPGDIVRDGQITNGQPRIVHGTLNHGGIMEIIWEDGGRSTVSASHTPSIIERDGAWIDQI